MAGSRMHAWALLAACMLLLATAAQAHGDRARASSSDTSSSSTPSRDGGPPPEEEKVVVVVNNDGGKPPFFPPLQFVCAQKLRLVEAKLWEILQELDVVKDKVENAKEIVGFVKDKCFKPPFPPHHDGFDNELGLKP